MELTADIQAERGQGTVAADDEPRSGAAISIRGLSKTFLDNNLAEVTPLKGVSLEIAAGEFVCLVGESGCGKTTLLNAIAGLIKPSAGDLQVLGLSPENAQKSMGMMFARDALLPWRTASKNVGLGLELLKTSRSTRAARVEECLELVGLGHVGHRYPWQLSQGMRQRVAIARTLATDPELLLMDEPFAAVDAQTRERLQTAFLDIWEKQRKTVVFVTHDLSEAIALADRIILMKHGVIDHEVVVPFERPRDLEHLRGSADYLTLYQDLHERLLRKDGDPT